MLDAIKDEITADTLIKDPEFIVILGDLAGHDRRDPKNIPHDLKTAFKLLSDKFANIPMLYVFGNNDALVKVEGVFYNKDATKGQRSPYEIAKNEAGWKGGFLSTWISCQKQNPQYPCVNSDTQNVTLGYYSAYLAPKIRFIAMNSMLFSGNPKNKAPASLADQQMEWLKPQLKESRSLGESVVIASHIPLGSNLAEGIPDKKIGYPYFKKKYEDKTNTLMLAYQKEIIAILFAHAHLDELKVFRDKDGRVVGDIVIVTPAMSTADGNSPGIKQFYINEKEGKVQLTDYEALRFEKSHSHVYLEKAYDFKIFYCRGAAVKNLTECIDPAGLEQKIEDNYTLDNPNNFLEINYPDSLFIDVDVGNDGAKVQSRNIFDKARVRMMRGFNLYNYFSARKYKI